jgi:hypothetical protein
MPEPARSITIVRPAIFLLVLRRQQPNILPTVKLGRARPA